LVVLARYAGDAGKLERSAGAGDGQQLPDREIMALAGLWETWKSPADEIVRSFTVITTTPNGQMEPIHNRMPMILPPSAWPLWLGEEEGTARCGG